MSITDLLRPETAPYLMTPAEACVFLRLADELLPHQDAIDRLRWSREQLGLRAIKIGQNLRLLRSDVERFVQELAERKDETHNYTINRG